MTITNQDVENVRARVSESPTFAEYCERMRNLEEIIMRQSREKSNARITIVYPLAE